MIRDTVVVLTMLGLLVTAGCQGDKAIGQACTSDRECATGVCLDLSIVEPICSGRVCTATCTQATDCPSGSGRPDCHVFSTERPNACLYADWVAQHCRMPPLPSQ